MKIGELCSYAPKSQIKAGEAIEGAKYMFFTSSADENKRYSDYQFDGEGIIMGTGGNATLHYYSGKYSTSTDCVVLLPNEKVRCKYLYYYLKANMNVLEAGFKGAGLKHTNKKYINDICIDNIPDCGKQDKIIYILDKIQDIIDAKNKELKLLDDLIKARFVEMFGDPVSNSYGLPEATLPELGEFGRGISKHRPRNDPKLLGGDYPLIQTGDVANAGLYITSYNSTYSEFGLKQSKMWEKGTLCITIAANIAKTAILTFDACFPDSVVGFTSNEKTNNIFIHYWFLFFQAILESQAPESAQKNINLKILSELRAIVPEKEKQDEFVDFIHQVDKSKVVVQKSLDETQMLFDSLMKKYFG